MTDHSTPSRDEVFAMIRDRGADAAVVRFSGGNDEGGCESILLVKDGERISWR